MAFSKEQAQRFARHFVLKEIGVSGQKQLLQSRVLVIGAGALGSGALLYLAAAGVGVIGIAMGTGWSFPISAVRLSTGRMVWAH